MTCTSTQLAVRRPTRRGDTATSTNGASDHPSTSPPLQPAGHRTSLCARLMLLHPSVATPSQQQLARTDPAYLTTVLLCMTDNRRH
uniref:Uncharacterized protein n=1 Tax=Triticum urartu TaxID=4572 RepID=A0A8R7QAH1_TRIUA